MRPGRADSAARSDWRGLQVRRQGLGGLLDRPRPEPRGLASSQALLRQAGLPPDNPQPRIAAKQGQFRKGEIPTQQLVARGRHTIESFDAAVLIAQGGVLSGRLGGADTFEAKGFFQIRIDEQTRRRTQ